MVEESVIEEATYNKKDITAALRKVKKLLKKWDWLVGWTGEKLTIVYYNNAKEMECDAGTGLRIYANWAYMRARIEVNLENILFYTEEQLELAVIHELMHLVVNPMSKKHDSSDIDQTEEFVCTKLSRCFYAMDKKNSIGK